MYKKVSIVIMLALGLCFTLAATASAQDSEALVDKAQLDAASAAPSTIMYQGRLTNAAGAPLTDTVTVTFGIYVAISGGSPLWLGAYLTHPDANGIITQELGPIPDTVFTGSKRYLEITVRTDPAMNPRQTLTSAPYALNIASPGTLIAPTAGFQFITCKSTSATPIAFGYVSSNGTKLSGTANFTSTWNATYKWYEITITAESYSLYQYTTVVTTAGMVAYFANTDSYNGKLLVYFFRL